jgi:uncharacterized secreted protein with C-terminal beta-propeller domain
VRSQETALVEYASCEALRTDLVEMLVEEVNAHYDQERYWYRRGPLGEVDAAPEASGDKGGREEGKDFSGTNNQEAGVDEADFVKTDGYHVYVLNGNRVHIFGVPEFGDLVPESTTEIEGHPREMMVHREAEKLVVFSMVSPYQLPEEHPLRARVGGKDEYDQWYWRVSDVTKLTVLDIADRKAPKLLREIYLEGWYQTARMVAGSVRMGAYSWMQIPGLYGWDPAWESQNPTVEERKARDLDLVRGLALEDFIPRIYERLPSRVFSTYQLSEDECSAFYRPTFSHARGVTSLLSLDLFSDSFRFDADQIISNWPTVYASKDYLYLAEPAHDWWWGWWHDTEIEQTNVHAFDIRTPGEASYVGSGRVDGMLHNQFSLGEKDGYLRVATTVNFWNRWWVEETERPQAENHVYVLGQEGRRLPIVGHLGNLARGERIFAARFVGDRGYLVTFRNVDPLFTLDLSVPAAPRVVGELKTPGFSTYLHPIADDRLLSIGYGGDENGTNWRTQISLFNVQDFAKPSLQDTEDLTGEDGWAWSEAQHEHKAFQYWGPKKLLAIPLSTYKNYTEGDQWYYSYTSRLELVSVDPEAGLSRYGSVDHSHFFNTDPSRYWYYTDVRRSIFMGDFVYAISDRGISVHVTDGLHAVTEQALPGYSDTDMYWWW